MNYKQRLKDIRTVLLDIDGVLTDGKVFLLQNEFVRNLSSKDAYAIQHAAKAGLQIIVITGSDTEHLEDKFLSLGITKVLFRVKNKYQGFLQLQSEFNLDLQSCAYMGDDLPDISLLKEVHLAACPQDAAPEVKHICHYVSHKMGGSGAVRDLLEQILKVQNLWWSDNGYEW